MATVSKSSPARRSRGIKAQTREQLIASALELLHSGGETAVTTVSVTRGAGIVQSAFYQHFANVEECLAVAAEQVTRQIRESVASARQRMYDARGEIDDSRPEVGKDLEESYRRMFKMVSRQRGVTQLFLRYRSDPLALNGVMHRFARGLSSDLAAQLTERAVKAGHKAPPRDWIAALADNLGAACLAAIDAHLQRRGPSLDESARLLAAFSRGACRAVFEALPSGDNNEPF
jgi:AcrR family transcriptional regulator